MLNVQTRFGALAYRQAGAGPPLVLLHAAAHDHHDFDAVFDALAAHHRVVALDLPGHGASSLNVPPRHATVVDIAQAVEAAVAELNLGPAVLMGNSVGGYSALKLAQNRPELVRGLVLVDTGGFNGAGLDVKVACAVKGNPWFTGVMWNRFPAFYTKTDNAFTAAMLARIAEAESPQTVALNAALWRSFSSPEHSLTHVAPRITVPTLVVWGRKDPVIPLAAGRIAARLLPNAELVTLDTGHVVFAEDPQGFLNVVLPFLNGVEGPATVGTATPRL